jgi:predicted kinase
MSPLEFAHQLNVRLLALRFSVDDMRKRMNGHSAALARAKLASRKSELRLQASMARLARCMESHGYE